MAFMNQERKRELVTGAKKVLAKYGMKATFRVRHHSTIVCTLKSGPIDFTDPQKGGAEGTGSINIYWINDHWTGAARQFLSELRDALMDGNHDNSRPEVDFFDVGWYVDIQIGEWKKPYIKTA